MVPGYHCKMPAHIQEITQDHIFWVSRNSTIRGHEVEGGIRHVLGNKENYLSLTNIFVKMWKIDIFHHIISYCDHKFQFYDVLSLKSSYMAVLLIAVPRSDKSQGLMK
ncbi:hypothetical protein TNCV_2473991 [Trichonephila clavipes]|nr:hypothetical protein TNCV_2473991 [Trichonephila clavipes]